MKNLLPIIFLLSCSSPSKQSINTEELRAKDEVTLNSLDPEPLRQGTMKKETEGRITTEIWTWKKDHGSPNATVETLIYKDKELISQTIRNEDEDLNVSRQFRNGKAFQISEETKNGADVVYLEDGKITGRVIYGKNPQCILYTNGTDPRSEKMDVCEEKFNNAP